jgi:hypothetical protein
MKSGEHKIPDTQADSDPQTTILFMCFIFFAPKTKKFAQFLFPS